MTEEKDRYRAPAASKTARLTAIHAGASGQKADPTDKFTDSCIGPTCSDRRQWAFPGSAPRAWPAAAPGEEFVPPNRPQVARFVSDPRTVRCADSTAW
jgi:hypothetical protein